MNHLPSPAAQIAFDFARPAARFDNFVVGRNAELLTRLRGLEFDRLLYLWGEPGCGKTHLLEAVAAAHPGTVIADDAQALDGPAQEVLFDAFNATLLGGPRLVVAGDRTPLQLALREDLRTRLGAGLVYAVQPLSDAEKRTAIAVAARERGLALGAEFIDYLLNHFRRDLRTLMALLDALDRHSLATKRPITLSLLKDLLQRNLLENS